MPYVRRGSNGQIESLHRHGESSMEFLPDGHSELMAFLGHSPSTSAGEFNKLDADFVRVIEDVIDTLIVKNVLNITDLPEQAQAKLLARKSFRERVSKSTLQLFQQPTDFGDVI